MTAPTTRTGGIDFAAILAAAVTSASGSGSTVCSPDNAAASALAAKVPERCPDCNGSGVELGKFYIGPDRPCPSCLTIGQMLREWQALTVLVEYATHDEGCPARWNRQCDCLLDAARAALEAVRGD